MLQNKPVPQWSNNILQGSHGYLMCKDVPSINVIMKTEYLKEWKWTHILQYSTKVKSKLIESLNVRPRTMKPWDNTGESSLTLFLAIFFWIWHK